MGNGPMESSRQIARCREALGREDDRTFGVGFERGSKAPSLHEADLFGVSKDATVFSPRLELRGVLAAAIPHSPPGSKWSCVRAGRFR